MKLNIKSFQNTFNEYFSKHNLFFIFIICYFNIFINVSHADTLVSGTIGQDTTWTLENSPYIVTSSIFIGKFNTRGSATLTIEPGVEVKVDPGERFQIGDYPNVGFLKAEGTAGSPIIFTSNSDNPAPGDWGGIRLGDWSNGSRLKHVVVEYATTNISANSTTHISDCILRYGSSYGVYTNTNNRAPSISNCAIHDNDKGGAYFAVNGSIEDSSIYQNGNNGVYIERTGSTTVRNNTINNNTLNAISISPEAVTGAVITGNSATGNTGNYLEVRGERIVVDSYWKRRDGLPYVVNGDIIIGQRYNRGTGRATLTIEAGTEIKFNPESSLVLGNTHTIAVGRMYYYGALNAKGVQDNPILFTANSDQPNPGDWKGILFTPFTLSGLSTLEHAIVEYAGTGSFDRYRGNASIYIDSASPTIKSSTIRFSGHTGIFLKASAAQIIDSEISDNVTGISLNNTAAQIFDSRIMRNTMGIEVVSTGSISDDESGLIAPLGLKIRNNHFSDNFQAMRWAVPILDVDKTYYVDARYNDWGDPSGPYKPQYCYQNRNGTFYCPSQDINENGLGDFVFGLIHVKPWIANREATPLTENIAHSGSIFPTEYQYFSFDSQAGASLLVEVTPQNASDLFSLSGDFDSAFGDQAISRITPRGNYELLFSPTQKGKYYFSLYGLNADMPGSDYFITARYLNDHYLSDISTYKAANNGLVTIALKGAGFNETTEVLLSTGELTTITPTEIFYLSATEIYATFDLNGVSPDLYNVQVKGENGPASILSDAFTITDEGNYGHLKAKIVAPEAVRPGRKVAAWLEYENDGEGDMPAPLFMISSNAPIRLTKNEPFSSNPIQVLAINQNGAAGRLMPGKLNRIPIQIEVPNVRSGGEIQFALKKMPADSTALDWEIIEQGMRPQDMDEDAWHVLFSNFKNQIGNTTGDLINLLSKNASYLSIYSKVMHGDLVGDEIYSLDDQNAGLYDVRNLLGFELTKASAGLSPRKILASSIDIVVPEPGLPLLFSRFAGQSIPDRFRLGPLGRGWFHSYEITLTENENGDVLIKRPGGNGGRIFHKTLTGHYLPVQGDFAALTLDAGIYQLREKNGMLQHFDSAGNLLSLQDRNENKLSFTYTANKLTGITHSNGESISIAYNAAGRITQVSTPEQSVVYRYDASDEHLLEVERAGGVISAYQYYQNDGSAAAHAIKTIINPDAVKYHYSYDALGRLIKEGPEGNTGTLTYAYDKYGTVNITDSLAAVVTLRYGSSGEILEQSDQAHNKTQMAYNQQGQLSRIIRPDGLELLLAYDANGNTRAIKDPADLITGLGFSQEYGNLAQHTDAKHNRVRYAYGAQGNLQTITYPDGLAEAFAYDIYGNPTEYTNRQQQTLSYTNNNRGQITRKIYPDGRTVDFVYNARGDLLQATDSKTGAINLSYGPRDFLTRIEYPGGYWFEFEYNDAGRRTKRTSHDGHIINYTYDFAGRLIQLTDGIVQTIVSYEYDIAGHLISEEKGNGTRTEYEYDLAGRVLNMTNLAPDNEVQSRFDYRYDGNGNRTQMTTLEGNSDYRYDALGQLIQAELPGGRVIDYAYDEVGNRISVSDDGQLDEYTSNSMNQYIQAGDTTNAYNENGNLISKTTATGTTTYHYDAESRLVEVQEANGDIWEYRYDALGNRMISVHNGETIRYIHDPVGLVDVAATYNGNGDLITRYTYGAGLVASTDAGSNDTYYAFDGNGNTRQLTDDTGVVINNYDYSPFGLSLQKQEAINNPFQYVGRFGVMQEGHGLQFMRARYYDADQSRFVSLDPIRVLAGDVNFYRYSLNNPVNLIDPSGLTFEGFKNLAKGGIYLYEEITVLFPTFTSEVHRFVNHFSRTPLGKRSLLFYGSTFLYSNPGTALIGITAYIYVTETIPAAIYFSETTLAPLWELFGNLWFTLTQQDIWDQWKDWVSKIIRSLDPNEKTSIAGISDQHYIVAGRELPYTVYFENKAEATAPAQEVFINDNLDTNLDWNSFQLGEVAFGDTIVTDLKGKMNGTTRVTVGDFVVEIEASFDPSTGKIYWVLRSLDPETGDYPADPFAGFLPPEDGNGSGQGYVSFSVKVKEQASNGTVIRNLADIVFDTNAAITTNEVFHTITDDAPIAPDNPTPVDGVVDISPATILNWQASDYATAYDLYLWQSGLQQPALPTASNLDSSYFDPSQLVNYGHSYQWKVVAKNVIGQVESPVWSFTTLVPPNQQPSSPALPSPLNGYTGVAINTQLSWMGGDPDQDDIVTYDVYFSPETEPLTKVSEAQLATTFVLPELSYAAGFHWQIIAKDQQGLEAAGPEWLFSTLVENANCSTSAYWVSDRSYSATHITEQSESSIGTTGTVVVSSDSKVTYQAPVLSLGAGFHAQVGSFFKATAMPVVCNVISVESARMVKNKQDIIASPVVANEDSLIRETTRWLTKKELPESLLSILSKHKAEAQYMQIDGTSEFISFTSHASLVQNDSNGKADIYLYHTLSETLTAISLNPYGETANGHSDQPRLSPMGEYIVYRSEADNLNVPVQDTNQVEDIYLYHIGGETMRISWQMSGDERNSPSANPAIEANDLRVIYDSNDEESQSHIYGFNFGEQASITNKFSQDTNSRNQLVDNKYPVISPDGRYIIYLELTTKRDSCQIHIFDRVTTDFERIDCPLEFGQEDFWTPLLEMEPERIIKNLLNHAKNL